MSFSRRIGLFLVTGLGVLAGLGVAPSPAGADQGVSTARVLGQLHSGNVREMRMGSLAIQHAGSEEVKAFGESLVRDHDLADTMVANFAKERGINLAANTPPVGPVDMPMGEGFDAAFARRMLKEHQQTIAEVTKARDGTSDPKLRGLLNELLPIFVRHEQMAQKLADQSPKS
jgi:putative membrane protein